MLTALSVARDCSMIERKDKVILAMVTPPIGNQPPSIEWTYAEDTKKNVTEVAPIRQVRIFFTDVSRVKQWSILRTFKGMRTWYPFYKLGGGSKPPF